MKKSFPKKIKFEDTTNGFKIEIPWNRNNFHLSFLILWLIGWVTIGSYVVLEFISGMLGEGLLLSSIAIYVSLMMIFGFLYAIGLIRFMLWGKEIIIVNNQAIQIDIKNYFLYKNKKYNLTTCRNLHVGKSHYLNAISTENRFYIFRLSKYGTVKFESGEKPISFGLELNQEDGKMIIEKFKSKGLIL